MNNYFYEVQVIAYSHRSGESRAVSYYIAPSQVGGKTRKQVEDMVMEAVLKPRTSKPADAGADVAVSVIEHAFWNGKAGKQEGGKYDPVPFQMAQGEWDIDELKDDLDMGVEYLVEWAKKQQYAF